MPGSIVLRQKASRHQMLVIIIVFAAATGYAVAATAAAAIAAAAASGGGGRCCCLLITVTHYQIIIANIEELAKRQLFIAAGSFGVWKINFRCDIVERLWWRVIDINDTSFTYNCQIDFFRIRLLLDYHCHCRRLSFLSVVVFQ